MFDKLIYFIFKRYFIDKSWLKILKTAFYTKTGIPFKIGFKTVVRGVFMDHHKCNVPGHLLDENYCARRTFCGDLFLSLALR